MKLKLTREPVTSIVGAIAAPEPLRSLTWCYVARCRYVISVAVALALQSCATVGAKDISNEPSFASPEIAAPLASGSTVKLLKSRDLQASINAAWPSLPEPPEVPSVEYFGYGGCIVYPDVKGDFKLIGITETWIPLTGETQKYFHFQLIEPGESVFTVK